MKNYPTIHLRGKQKQRLKKIYKKEEGRPSQRAHMVLLRNQGYTLEEIASICHYNRNTVSAVLERFKKSGIQGLYDKDRSGSPKTLDESDENYLLEAIEKSPLEYNYRNTTWSVPLMQDLVQSKRGKEISRNALRDLISQRGWVFKRPKHIPAEPLPLQENQKKEILELLKNPHPDRIVLFLDESDFQWLPYITGTWVRKGQNFEIPTPGKNKVFSVFGGFDVHNKQFVYKIVHGRKHKTAKNFIIFLHQIRARFQGKEIHVIVDNASIHNKKTKLLKKFREEYSQVRIHFLPTRTTVLNPIERFWLFVKRNIASNHLYADIEHFAQAFRNYIKQFQMKRITYNFDIKKLIRIWEKYPVENPKIDREFLATLKQESERTLSSAIEIEKAASMLGNL